MMCHIADKLLSPSSLLPFIRSVEGQRVVFTNGCFDILHVGHVTYLEKARKLGDILVVGVNSDASVTRLKGPSRPIMSLESRMKVLAALQSVNAVIAFEEDTPLTLITCIKPAILVKGGDYEKEKIVGYQEVTSYGGKVEVLPFIPGQSTTAIIDKITEQ